MNESSFLEKTWDAILSRDPERVCKAFLALQAADQAVIMDHLRKMVSEPGWHPEQVISAREALKALEQEN